MPEPTDKKSFSAVAPVADVPEGSKKLVTVGGVPVLLCHSAGAIFAVSNICSHAQESLDCGRMRNGWIACPVHGARFDLVTGEPLNAPATQPIATFEVRITGDMIELLI
jgi:3-phenylpropionate/trans-cinnamate dioxygenase ferredoxin subunit